MAIEVGDDVLIKEGRYGHKNGDYGRVMEIVCPFGTTDHYVVFVECREQNTNSIFPPGHVAYLRDNIELVSDNHITPDVFKSWTWDLHTHQVKQSEIKENNNDLLLLL